ncbi:MAG: ATP-binding protein [Thermodesulfovibrionales bacterium]|nr:ATP-binding protein [Thermodesulfovibrionales bacterium]
MPNNSDAFEKLFRLSGSPTQQLADIMNAISDSVMMHTPDLMIVWANQAAVDGFGTEISNLAGQYCYSLWHNRSAPCEQCPVLKSFKTGEPENVHISTPKGMIWDLKAIPVKDKQGKVINVIEIGRDITRHRKLEDQLRQSQKMEAIGTLTGGIAHDFNNILTAIIGYGSILKMKLEQDSALMPYTDQILASSERAATLVRSLLTFSRKQAINLEQVDLNELIKRVERLLSRIIGEDIELQTALADNGLTVVADTLQMEQVLMNLAANARDAMPDGGLIIIETGLVEFDEEYEKVHGYGKPGMYALIAVTDGGCGMDEETRLRIFEPFFTTKAAGRGTGLGLSIVYGIIKQHNGYINCYSEPGKGTTFKVYLPIAAVNSGMRIADIFGSDASRTKLALAGTETVLVAEDEEEVRKLVKVILEEFGYQVIEAVDGEDAINKFMDNKDRIGVVFLDMIMPKMSGEEACEIIKKIKPEMKVLFSSGYPADFLSRRSIAGVTKGELNFIIKPVSPTELLKKVRGLLDTDRKQ